MARRTTSRRRRHALTRDKAIFSVGLVGSVNEIFIRSGPERPTIIALLVGMMGLPAFLRWDDVRGERDNGTADDREDR